MGVQDDFVGGATVCMNPTFAFPSITSPGLPNFLLGCFGATLAGINYVLQYIPPSPDNLPSLPSIDLFLAPMMSTIKLPSSYPSISFDVLTIPGAGSAPYPYPLDAEMKLVALGVLLPYNLIKSMITDLLNLQVTLPTLAGIQAKFGELAASLGLAGESIIKLGGCLAHAIFDLFSSLI